MEFRELVRRVFALHRAGRYSEALGLIDRGAPRHPDRAETIALFRTCLLARSGDLDGAVEELALWLALTGAIEAVGCIMVAPSPNAAEFYRQAIARRVRVSMVLGAEDATYLERGVALAEALRGEGLDCRVETVAGMGHEFPAGFAEEFLRAALGLVGG